MSGPVYEYPWQNPEWGPEWNPHDQCADQIGRLTTELNEARAELEEWKRASGPECGGSPDDVTPQDLEESLGRYRAELESAVSQIATDNEVCACGCSMEDHESYEEGISCGHDDHECITTCVAIAGTLAKLRDERDALAVEMERLHGAWDCDGEVHGPWCREWRKMEAEAGRLRSALAPATMTKLEAWDVLSRCDSGYQQCAKCPALACCDNDAGRALLKKGGK